MVTYARAGTRERKGAIMASVLAKKGTAASEVLAEDDHLEARYGIEEPYTVTVRLRGVTPLLFNKFADLDGYAEARVAPKRKPREKEVLDYDAMVWRTDDGQLGIPVQNVIASLVGAARYFKSPIASSGGATTTLREALVPADEIASFGVDAWDCIDFRLARNGDIKRSPKPTWRPRLEKGWLLTADIGVVLPELYGPAKLMEIISRAGTTSGLGDGRRFVPDGFDIADGLPW
jgi:hypothetical protein